MPANYLYYNTLDGALTVASNTSIDSLSEYILELMASNTYTGTITLGTTNPIGTFTDTARQGAVGSNDITILSNTYTLSQVNTTTLGASNNAPFYVGLDLTSNVSQVIIQENATSLATLADDIITRMVAGGPNSYYLGNSSPTDGGTWVSRGVLLDTIENFTITNNTYHLWHKVSSPTYTSANTRPIKLGVAGELQEFTDNDLQLIIKTIEERIVATGIGFYVLQEVAPVTGTWVSAGSITDAIRGTTDVDYTGDADYATASSYSIDYATNYDSTIDYANTYTGEIEYTGLYTGAAINYALDYVGTTDFTGLTYVGDGPNYTASYTSDLNYDTGYLSAPTVDYNLTFTAIALYDGPDYVLDVQYETEYIGTEAYDSDFIGAVSYTADYSSTLSYDSTPYTGGGTLYLVTFAGGTQYVGAATYTGSPIEAYLAASYLSGEADYTGTFSVTSTYLFSFSGFATYTGTFTADTSYLTTYDIALNYTPTYQGPDLSYDLGYQSETEYSTTYTLSNTYDIDYAPETNYIGTYTSDVSYATDYTTETDFSGTYLGGAANYDTAYTADVTYVTEYTTEYAGPDINYAGDGPIYTGAIVSSSITQTSVTLWRRIA